MMDTGILKAKYEVSELKLKKAGWKAGAVDMAIVKAEMEALQFKVAMSEN